MTLTLNIPDAKYQRILDAFEATYSNNPEYVDPDTELKSRVKSWINDKVNQQEKNDAIDALVIPGLDL